MMTGIGRETTIDIGRESTPVLAMWPAPQAAMFMLIHILELVGHFLHMRLAIWRMEECHTLVIREVDDLLRHLGTLESYIVGSMEKPHRKYGNSLEEVVCCFLFSLLFDQLFYIAEP